jgi:hypothetical protein
MNLNTMKNSLITMIMLLAGVLTSCDRNEGQATITPTNQVASNAEISYEEDAVKEVDETTNEIFDDSEDGARAAAIDTAVAVKWQINVTSSCSGTGSASFKYHEGTSTSGVLSASAATAALGFKSFSVPVAKFNTVVLKTFDKTKVYLIYAKIPGVKAVQAVGTMGQPGYVAKIPAIPVTYKRVVKLSPNPAAEKKMNSAGTKRIGLPITTEIKTIGCPL